MAESSLRAVIDTNVWVSAILNPAGPPAAVLEAFRGGRFLPVLSISLLNEIKDVLSRPRLRTRFPIDDEAVDEVVALIEDRAARVVAPGALRICRDPRDDHVLEAAIAGQAAYLVTRDDDIKRDWDLIEHLGGHGVEVLSVAAFLRRLPGS